MQTRRDQVQAHAFVAGRLVSAMLRAEPDAPNTPLRRFVVGSFCGVLLGVLLIAGFGIFGYFKPGGKKAFRTPGALIVEKETGSRYVLVDGQLRPVLNFGSAKLILGSDLRVVNVSRNSMKGVPHGLPVGIPGAPDSLPDPKDLDATNWQVCSALQPNISGDAEPFVRLRVGEPAPGAASSAVSDDQALLIRTPDGTRYLAWKNRRLRIASDAVVGALGYGSARQHLVGAAFVNALPAGPDLVAPGLDGRGEPGPVVDGTATLVGQVFNVAGAGIQEQFFLVTRTGLAALTPTGAALVLGDARTKEAYPGLQVAALPLDPAALAAAPRADGALLDPGLPPTPPQAVSAGDDTVPCLQITLGGTETRVRVALGRSGDASGATAAQLRRLSASVGGGSGPARPVTPSVPSAPRLPATPEAGADGGFADEITVGPGSGLLIRAQPGPRVPDGARYLLVDTGYRYPLSSDEAVRTLGYDNLAPVAVPTPLLSLIPSGRPLDPAAAKTTQPVPTQVGSGG